MVHSKSIILISFILCSVFMSNTLGWKLKHCGRVSGTTKECKYGSFLDRCGAVQCFQGPNEDCSKFIHICNPTLICDEVQTGAKCRGCVDLDIDGNTLALCDDSYKPKFLV